MKVEVKDEVFQPVVITIETQKELDAVNEALSVFLNETAIDPDFAEEWGIANSLFETLPLVTPRHD
jgi:hypothetical protein